MTIDVARDHIIRVLVESELESERKMAEWWTQSQDGIAHQESWADLYAEHKARLALLERIVEAAK